MSKPRTIAIGAFDGVHAGHRALLEAARRPLTLLTWAPAPGDELLCSLERRVELLQELGASVTVASSRRELPATPAEVVVLVDPDANDRRAWAEIASALAAGDIRAAAGLLGRPPEVEGIVVGGDARGRTLGYPTANVEPAAGLVLPRNGIYAGSAAGVRAAISIGTNPTYGGVELRVEAFLLDFEGDLYGRRLVLELWERLRDEAAFASEAELVAAIGDDVARTRAAVRPS